MIDLRHRISEAGLRYGVAADAVGLVIAAILVHLVYAIFIDPSAAETMSEASESGMVPERTLAIVFKDLEQEICLILSLWCLWLWAFRYRLFADDGYLIDRDFLKVDSISEYSEEALNDLDTKFHESSSKLPQSELVNSVGLAIDRIRLNGRFQEAIEVASGNCDLHLDVLNSKLSITRYILWAIPSIGFIGTVRGIGDAMAHANEAMAGDLSAVAASLGIAFNSTFVALFLSLILNLVSSSLHGREERLVVRFKHYTASKLIPRLNALAAAQTVPTSRQE